MKLNVNFNSFVDAFNNAGRQDNFSYEALQVIFGYIEDYEQDSGEEIELDVIALCCEWTEESPEQTARDYDIDISEDENSAQVVLEYLWDNTQAYELDNGNIVYVNF